MAQMGRRGILKAGAALGSLTLMGSAHAQESDPETDDTRPPFRAAVMRVPVLVPPSEAALEDVRRRNAESMVASIENLMQAEPVKPRIVVFPVLQYTSARRAVSGVPMTAVAVDLVSEPLDKGIFAPVIEACRRHNCYVATSTQEKVPQLPGTYFHTGFIMGPEGLVLRSPKAQAQSAPAVSYLRDIKEDYLRVFGPESIMPVVKTPLGTLACFVEGEAEVLEASRLLTSKGAEIILHTSLEEGEIPWQALKQAIGFQCHVYLLTGATSRVIMADDPAGEWSGGASTIVGPDGRVLASKGGQEEGYAAAEIDLAEIAAAKKKFGRNTVPAWGLYEDLYRG
jgi:predicted amidohydrolase